MSAEPTHDEFMDSEMLRFWERIEPLPGDLRLYGGTALALYLNHRQSTDFDFATPSPVVDLDFVMTLPWMEGAHLQGGAGMVDALIKGNRRDLNISFMECGRLIPYPVRKPMTAPNGIAVAHPVDLMAAKAEACISRGELRDYEDIAAAFGAWPEWNDAAIGALPARSAAIVGRTLAAPPTDVEAVLTPELQCQLRHIAREIGRSERGFEQ